MSRLHERIQDHLDHWIHQITAHFQAQRSRALVSYNSNKELILEYSHVLYSKVHDYIDKNVAIQRILQSLKHNFLHVSRKIVSPLVRELGRNSLASGALGFVLGLIVYRITFGQRSYSIYSPMKPQKMKGIECRKGRALKSYDGLESLRYSNTIDTPRITNPDQVLVRVMAVSVDPADISILSGLGWYERTLSESSKDIPLILGRDFSGEVVEVGRNVSHIRVGETVWGSVPILENLGSMAEFIVLPGERARRKPLNISHEGAATVPFSGIQAWTSLGELGIYPNAAKGLFQSKIILMIGSRFLIFLINTMRIV